MSSKKASDKKSTEDEKPIKVDKWDTTAVKNALDDGAKKVMLERFGCQESHALMDGRLLICTIAVGFAAFALIWDFIKPFPLSRPILITCVVSYFVLMVVLTVYTTYKEMGIFLVALDKDKAGVDPDDKWTLSSNLKKYDDMYSLRLEFQNGKTKQTRHASFAKSVANFFDENGVMCQDLLEPHFAKLYQGLASSKKDK